MKFLIPAILLASIPLGAAAQELPQLPKPTPASDVFTREQIGHAIAAPTPGAGRTHAPPSAAPKDDGQWTMPAKNYAATRYSAMNEINASKDRKSTRLNSSHTSTHRM